MARTSLMAAAVALTAAFTALPGWAQGAGPREPPAVRERVVMPYGCRIEQGRVELTPGPEIGYDVLDRREQMPFAGCVSDSAGCRAWNLHRFHLVCGGHRVAWAEVVAAAARHTPYRIRPTAQGLVLIPRLASPQRTVRDCFDELASGPILPPVEHRAAMIACWQGRWRDTRARPLELPPGFAPLGLMGARIQAVPPAQAATLAMATPRARAEPRQDAAAAAAPPPRAEPAPAEQPGPMAAPAARQSAPALPRPLALPEPSVAAVDPTPGAPVGPPVLRATTPDAAAPEPSRSQPHASAEPDPQGLGPIAVPAALIATVVAALLWWRRRHSPAASLRIDPVFDARGPDPDAAMSGLMLQGARRMHDEVAATLAALDPALPIRQVLAKELRRAGQRLAQLEAERPATAPAARRLRTRVQAAVRDVERLREIAAGAHRSMAAMPSGSAAADLTPTDRASACAVLGVTPDADEGTLKKLVDALRRAWHPDLARDEPDRVRREARIKQINVAWDLIQGRRIET